MADENDDLLDPAEIEALLNSNLSPGAPAGDPTSSGGAGVPAGWRFLWGRCEKLSQGDLDSLFQQSARGLPESPSGSEILGASEIDSLLKDRETRKGRSGSSQATEALLDRVESDLAAALAPETRSPFGRQADLKGVKEYEFNQFDAGTSSEQIGDLEALNEVELDLRIELGRTQLLIEEVLKLREGSVVPLDKLAGDPVDILVNGRLVARGEVLVLNDNFCVRIAEIVSPSF